MDPYCFEARNILRAQLAYKGVSLAQLAELLVADGAYEEPRALSAKVNRGKFSFTFFLRCMKVLGMDGGFVLLPKHDDKPQQTRKPPTPSKVIAKGRDARRKSPLISTTSRGTPARKRNEEDVAAS